MSTCMFVCLSVCLYVCVSLSICMSVCVYKMAGQFRSSQWDPVLIVSQIIAMQCLFYVGLGTCVAVIDFILGYSQSLGQLFLYQVSLTHSTYTCYVMSYRICLLVCVSVFQRFQWSGTLCSNFDCSWNPCLFWGRGCLRAELKFKITGREWGGILGDGA